jgi:[glutamine synthetase] adenylyltransferase / [glutamine synthetase]-adenylyl-L-tyrosine phosphorylase
MTAPAPPISSVAVVPLIDQLAANRGSLFQVDERGYSLEAEFISLAASDPTLSSLSEFLTREPVRILIQTVFHGSPYLKGLILRDPQRFQRILASDPHVRATQAISTLHDDMTRASTFPDAMRTLRVFKSEIALLTALADLGHVYDLTSVTTLLTQCGDAAVQSAVRLLFRWATERGDWVSEHPTVPETDSGYFVLGMGKYGAHELNYSSDIDLIIFYDPRLARLRAGLDLSSFYVRITRDLVRLLSERTSDGYVFRTDLRLRPDAGATQVALSIDAARHYYESVGQNWERAAFIKARAVGGDIPSGEAFLAELAPFVWRRYLDFAAIADIHAMKRQIHAHRRFGEIAVPGHNIKLGRGGIREIEFFVQTQQLIAGGRQSDLRTRQTRVALQRLQVRGWITPDVASSLDADYVALRTIEHRIQMVADEQSHELPNDPDELERFAHFADYHDTATFSAALVPLLQSVQAHYSRLFESSPELTTGASNMVFAGEADDPATMAALTVMGYSQPATVIATVRSWHHGRYRAVRSPQARERLTEVQPLLIEALGLTANPDAALGHFDRFLSELPTSIQLFALLRAKPGLMQLLADIMGSAPRLARILSRRHRLFDAVLDPSVLGLLPSERDYQGIVAEALTSALTFEGVLDAVRIVGNEQSFLIGVRTLAGAITAIEAGGAYSRLAEVLIGALQDHVERELARVHGTVPGGGVVVVALGKLGGREMTPTSDLDLIVIYDVATLSGGQAPALSNGARPLAATQYYARFTQRLVSALSAPTAEGTLYEVDLRLRPSGQKGPIATSLASFVAYQRDEAWTWEHMALTRARVVSGPAPLRREVESAVAACLTRPRDISSLAADVREMRERIANEKGAANIWDLKQVRGGLVDIEFIVQYLQLLHACAHPGILATNIHEALAKLAANDLIVPPDFDILSRAARLLSELIGTLRLRLDGPFSPQSAPPDLQDVLARCGDAPSFSSLEADLKDTLNAVHQCYNRILGHPSV